MLDAAARRVIRVLLGSRFYLDLSLRERYDLIRYVLKSFPYNV